MHSEVERKESPYKLKFTNGLPPGTDTLEQFEKSPRLPRPPAQSTRSTPQWPAAEHRKGKWISKYLDQLDPETEYDQIIRTGTFFFGSDFSTALGYAAVFCILTQTPAGAVAVHGGKIIKRGHQRYYETQLLNLQWVFHGSGSPETKEYVEKVNRVHSGVWKRVPGAISAPWEAQTAIISLSYFEAWVRKTVGARNPTPHPKIQQAYPNWGERLCAHFVTEPQDGSRTMGINYPRSWEELEKFFFWFDDFPFEEQTTPEQRRKGNDTAEAFVNQFCELWFPTAFQFIGRHVLLTFIPPGCRRRQGLEEPNLVISFFTKLILKVGIDANDFLFSDPVEPPMAIFREMLISEDLNKADEKARRYRRLQDQYLMLGLSFLILLPCGALYRYLKL